MVDGKPQYTVCLSFPRAGGGEKAVFLMPQMVLMESTKEIPNPVGFDEDDIIELRNFINENKEEIDEIAIEEASDDALFFEADDDMVEEVTRERGIIETEGFSPSSMISQSVSSLNSQPLSSNMSNKSDPAVV
jgi:hypothetical protein